MNKANGSNGMMNDYIGRIAPTPSGRLHKGHAFTFGVAYYRARKCPGGRVYLKLDDLDSQRCKPEFAAGVVEDLRWLGFVFDDAWSEGASACLGNQVILQSKRMERYREVLLQWIASGWIYPSGMSRKQLRQTPDVKRSPDGEVIFPEELRPVQQATEAFLSIASSDCLFATNWRWLVPYGKSVGFVDKRVGEAQFFPGRDFGDFLVWRKDGFPSYEMAVVVDDLDFKISEVVRGEDLLLSTARQCLIYRAMGKRGPDFYHCPLVKDEHGVRLAKSYDSESIESYRAKGCTPSDIWDELAAFGFPEAAGWLAGL